MKTHHLWTTIPSIALPVITIATLSIYITIVLKSPDTYWTVGATKDSSHIGDYPLQQMEYYENKQRLTINYSLSYYESMQYHGQKTDPQIDKWQTRWIIDYSFYSVKWGKLSPTQNEKNNIDAQNTILTTGLSIDKTPSSGPLLSVNFSNVTNDYDQLTNDYSIQIIFDISANSNFGIMYKLIDVQYIFYLNKYEVVLNIAHRAYND